MVALATMTYEGLLSPQPNTAGPAALTSFQV